MVERGFASENHRMDETKFPAARRVSDGAQNSPDDPDASRCKEGFFAWSGGSHSQSLAAPPAMLHRASGSYEPSSCDLWWPAQDCLTALALAMHSSKVEGSMARTVTRASRPELLHAGTHSLNRTRNETNLWPHSTEPRTTRCRSRRLQAQRTLPLGLCELEHNPKNNRVRAK